MTDLVPVGTDLVVVEPLPPQPCTFCEDPVFPREAGDDPTHPCCVIWRAMGARKCRACAESKRLAREQAQRTKRNR